MQKFLFSIIIGLLLITASQIVWAKSFGDYFNFNYEYNTGPLPDIYTGDSKDVLLLPGLKENYLPIPDPTNPDFFSSSLSDESNGKDTIETITRYILTYAGAFALLMIVVGGIMYITAHGDEEQAGKAKKTIVAAIVGMIIILSAYVIVAVILNLGPLTSGSIT